MSSITIENSELKNNIAVNNLKFKHNQHFRIDNSELSITDSTF
jgi:hypothetical protein